MIIINVFVIALVAILTFGLSADANTTKLTRRAKNPYGMSSLAQDCSIGRTLLQGAALRVASDLTGGTALENIKTRVTTNRETPLEAFHSLTKHGGIGNLWSGSSSRIVEGSLVGAVFMLGSALTKKQVLALGGSKPVAALCGGLIGGIAQAFVMTPAGLVFTSLNTNRGSQEYSNDNAVSVTRRIYSEKGLSGMYAGLGPMSIRQASNWASRATLTEVARSSLKLSRWGLVGEIGSGILGGIGSCWNTPIETVRVLTQRDVSTGVPPKSIGGYFSSIVEEDGYRGLYRGVTPRAMQAIWQTCFMVVVPNILSL